MKVLHTFSAQCASFSAFLIWRSIYWSDYWKLPVDVIWLGLLHLEHTNTWQEWKRYWFPWIKPDVLEYLPRPTTHPQHYIFVPISFPSANISSSVLFDNGCGVPELCQEPVVLHIIVHQCLIQTPIWLLHYYDHSSAWNRRASDTCTPEETILDELASEESNQIPKRNRRTSDALNLSKGKNW